MKNNTVILSANIVILFFLALTSCDERFQFLSGTNRSPVIYINNKTDLLELSDSLKTSLKNGKPEYNVTITFSDPEKQLKSVSVSLSGGTGVLKQDGNVVTEQLDPSNGNANLSFRPDAPGIYTFNFTASDSFEKSATATLTILVFNNIVPVASFIESKVGVNSPYEYELNAGGSFDPDKKKGGGIQAYRYLVNNTVEIITTQSVIKYVFPGTGGQDVKLEAYDNDGAKSTLFTKVIQVN
jgi:hypothetical protein